MSKCFEWVYNKIKNTWINKCFAYFEGLNTILCMGVGKLFCTELFYNQFYIKNTQLY